MIHLPLPLRWSLPAILLVAGILAVAVAFRLDDAYFRRLAIEEALADARLISNRTAARAEQAFRQREPTRARNVLDGLASDPQIDYALILDPDQRVLFATDYALEGRLLEATPHDDSGETVQTAVAENRQVVDLGRREARLVIATPLVLLPNPGQLVPSSGGALLLAWDLAHPIGMARTHALRHTLDLAGAVAVLVLLVWWLLRELVTRRVSRLVEATEAITAGEFGADPGLRGKDELAYLSRSVTHMASSLGSATADLARSERRFRELIEHGVDVILVVDSSGAVRYASPSAERLLGTSAEELAGTSVFDLIEPDDRVPLRDALLELQRGEAFHRRLEIRMQPPQGGLRLLDVTAYTTPGLQEAGQIVFNGHDITRRRALEEELRQAQKMEAIGRLAGGVAHDFNNLLTAILGYCDLLAGQLPPERPAAAQLGEIRRAAERAADLTRQLLAFGRRQMLRPVILDLNDVLVGLEDMLRRLLGEQVQLELNVTGEPLWVKADRTQLEQVIVNLAVNGRDAMPNGGTLSLHTRLETLDEERALIRGLEPGPSAILRVADAGSGIPPERLERIFEPFFTTKEMGKGTGLGLATVLGIVQQSGGHIQVESVVGEGTAFELLFPLAGPGEIPEEPRQADPVAGTAGGETILVAEDDPAIRRLAVKVLSSHGYRVLEAGDGQEAREVLALSPWPVDLLVTDVVMPRGHGPDLAEELLRDRPGARVLFISGYGMDVLDRQGIHARVPLLMKPFSPESLLHQVRAALDAPPG